MMINHIYKSHSTLVGDILLRDRYIPIFFFEIPFISL